MQLKPSGMSYQKTDFPHGVCLSPTKHWLVKRRNILHFLPAPCNVVVPKWAIPVPRMSPQRCSGDLVTVSSDCLSSVWEQSGIWISWGCVTAVQVTWLYRGLSMTLSCDTYVICIAMIFCNIFFETWSACGKYFSHRGHLDKIFSNLFTFVYQFGSLIGLIYGTLLRGFIFSEILPHRSLSQRPCWFLSSFLTCPAFETMYNCTTKRMQTQVFFHALGSFFSWFTEVEGAGAPEPVTLLFRELATEKRRNLRWVPLSWRDFVAEFC